MNTTKSAIIRAALPAILLLCVSGLQAQDAPATAPALAPSGTAAPAPGGGGAQDIMQRILQMARRQHQNRPQGDRRRMGGDPAFAGQGRESAIRFHDVWKLRFRMDSAAGAEAAGGGPGGPGGPGLRGGGGRIIQCSKARHGSAGILNEAPFSRMPPRTTISRRRWRRCAPRARKPSTTSPQPAPTCKKCSLYARKRCF